jgi:hypothetical protein
VNRRPCRELPLRNVSCAGYSLNQMNLSTLPVGRVRQQVVISRKIEFARGLHATGDDYRIAEGLAGPAVDSQPDQVSHIAARAFPKIVKRLPVITPPEITLG